MLKSFFNFIVLFAVLFLTGTNVTGPTSHSNRIPASSFDICQVAPPNDRYMIQRREIIIAGRCQENQALCRTNEQCCSGVCGMENRCHPTPNFKNINSGFCSFDEDCCSGLCEGNRCQGSSSYCAPIAAGCAGNDQCCSGICSDKGRCVPSQIDPGLIGDACSIDQQCRSGACLRGRCL